MKKLGLGILITVTVLAISGIAGAMLIPAADQAKDRAEIGNSPVIEGADQHLALTPPGLEKIVYIHYKKGFVKPPWAGGGKKPKEAACYDFLGRGVKWQELPVNYVIDPDNEYGLTKNFMIDAIRFATGEWDNHTSAELFGTYSIDYNSSWDSDVPDGRNEFVFDNYSDPNVIAVAVVWGYFTGPPQTRKIIEFDVLFDTDFIWGDASMNPVVMDLQNIATHEIGHGIGLGDVYEDSCSAVTMYGYSGYGETQKRDLGPQDITGLQKLYGINLTY